MGYRPIVTQSEQEWLAARRRVVTATDLATLYTRTRNAWQRVLDAKYGKDVPLTGKAIEWGHEREPEIGAYATKYRDGSLKPNNLLWVSDEYPMVGATPDMIGRFTLGELKTTGTGWTPADVPVRYYNQVQAQLAVFDDKDSCFLVWEKHTDFAVIDPPRCVQIPRDEQRIRELLEISDEFVSWWLDGVTPTWMLAEESDDPALFMLCAEYEVLTGEKKKVTSRLEDVREQIMCRVGEHALVRVGDFEVKRVERSGAVRFDSKRFKLEQPDVWSEYVVQGAPSVGLSVTNVKGK